MKTIGYVAANKNKKVEVHAHDGKDVLAMYLEGAKAGVVAVLLADLVKDYWVEDPEKPPKADLWCPEDKE